MRGRCVSRTRLLRWCGCGNTKGGGEQRFGGGLDATHLRCESLLRRDLRERLRACDSVQLLLHEPPHLRLQGKTRSTQAELDSPPRQNMPGGFMAGFRVEGVG